MTTTTTVIILLTMIVAQAICAPQATNTFTVRTPANMSYEELEYILNAKNGQPQKKLKTLSSCARAILGCCKDEQMNSNCSESLGCGALFFDSNPCADKFVEDALKAARSFYEQLDKVPNPK